MLSLPVLRDLDPEAIDDEDRDERAQWIDLVLTSAESLVDDIAAVQPTSRGRAATPKTHL